MRIRSFAARMAAVFVLLVATTGLLTACGHEGTVTGAALGAVVGGAIGSTYDDPYYHDPYYYYATGPGEYDSDW